MKAVAFKQGKFTVKEWKDLTPGPDQLLVEPLAVGICGSDLSAVEHTLDFLTDAENAGSIGQRFDEHSDLVFGHEFSAKVITVGANVTEYAPGDLIVVLPWILGDNGVVYTVGYANGYPGALAERCLVGNGGHIKIPQDVNPFLASLTEPFATGYNSVVRSKISTEGALVTGAGVVGLGAVIALTTRNVYPIVVSEPSKQRREMARKFGAQVVVNPYEEDPVEAYKKVAKENQRLYVFEASGVVNLVHNLFNTVPHYTKFFVVGASMVDNLIRPTVGINKNLSIEYVTGPDYGEMGYGALTETFRDLVEGKFDPAVIAPSFVGYEGVAKAFEALRPASGKLPEFVKILVMPGLQGDKIYSFDEVDIK